MAVNLSSRQFRQKDLAGKIRTVLAETGCDPKYLELELTESMLVQNAETAIAVMSELRRIGIRISLDDFGTGYASLSYLKRFPIDTLKIDQSFVREVTSDANSAAIADAIIGMAHSLRLTVLAEGVETEGQLAWLRTRGCDQMQGYLFCKPVPSGELAELLRERRCLPTRARAAAGPTLLLLDDEQNVLSALRRALRADNYRILTADSPKAAFELLAQNTIQVIVSDQRMPEMNGTEFFGRVKDLYPDTVRIMLSEYSEIQAVTEAINRGAVYKYLHKPWEDEVLRATIKEAFQIQRSEAIGISSLSTAADYRCVLDEIAGERGALPRLV
jgi:CheY-like chemotaxis protein